jgi:hypothetical protein
MGFIRRCGISILAVGLLFALVNLFHFWRYVSECYDCAIKWGIPFAFRQSEGFATGPRFLWPGLIEDFAFVLTTTLVAVLAWNAFEAKNSK